MLGGEGDLLLAGDEAERIPLGDVVVVDSQDWGYSLHDLLGEMVTVDLLLGFGGSLLGEREDRIDDVGEIGLLVGVLALDLLKEL